MLRRQPFAPAAHQSLQRLLFIDDSPQTQRLASALSEWGCDVEVSSSATDALATLAWFRPEAVIMELKLQDASGLDCFRQIRMHRPDTRVIILTAYPSIATAVYAVRHGAWDYLVKPTSPEQLLTALTRDPAELEVDLPTKSPSLCRLEWEHIQRVLAEHDGNISHAATALGLHRRSLQRKLMKLPPAE